MQPLPYEQFIAAFGMPGFLARAGAKVSHERTGIDLDAKTFIPDVKHITVPTLVVQNENDPWSTPEIVQAFYDELRVEKEMLWLDLAKQRAAAYDYLGTNPEFIAQFFGKHM